jgi:hypothetical protein
VDKLMTSFRSACDTALIETALEALRGVEFGYSVDRSVRQIMLLGRGVPDHAVFVTVGPERWFNLVLTARAGAQSGITFTIQRTERSTWVTYGSHRIELDDFPQPAVQDYIERLVNLANQMQADQTPKATLESGAVAIEHCVPVAAQSVQAKEAFDLKENGGSEYAGD